MIYDVIGIGFGPANLAIAATIEEQGFNEQSTHLFIESKSEFDWHPGMLIEGARMQISYHKDLATMRSPTSKFTFLNYLDECGRLESFVNLQEFYPTRHEYRDYLKWAANQLKGYVNYGEKVVDITPVMNGNDEVSYINVHTVNAEGKKARYQAKNIITSSGLVPKLPEGIHASASQNAYHSSQFLPSLENKFSDTSFPWEFLVVGSGQSAAEITKHLLNHYPNATVNSTIREYAYKPADSSEFVNEIFAYSTIDDFYKLEANDKQRIINKYKDTNYSCIDPPLIRELYQMKYDMSVSGDERFKLNNFQELKEIKHTPNMYHVGTAYFENTNTKEQTEVPYHGVFLATGYHDRNNLDLTQKLFDWFEKDELGRPKLTRQYQVKTSDKCHAGIFMIGNNEHSHGLSDTLLSILPERAMDIMNEINSAKPNYNIKAA
ncbi:lysine N(6)-hydroxylase/L-ornithine N(5)-oxygenase family protein [Vibrio penaeicida]|uniref:Lysine/ornithine N-monooxygenase n=2 Tax=Vibrio penaeicida TaxID=104609 RepID=A0AAV5NRI3_9VIBR|nr:SidA/IucD/PvdA family monooxygenase [Vibrio penaeicida]GLQ73040.1 lysine/ornithine N-monooxygenase [Vibrio penaeicida]